MIQTKKLTVEELRIKRMKIWMNNADGKVLQQIIESRATNLEFEYLKLSIEAGAFPAKESNAAQVLDKIMRFRNFLEVWKEVQEQKTPFELTVAVNPE